MIAANELFHTTHGNSQQRKVSEHTGCYSQFHEFSEPVRFGFQEAEEPSRLLDKDGVVLGDNLRSEVLPRCPARPSPFFTVGYERRVPAPPSPAVERQQR